MPKTQRRRDETVLSSLRSEHEFATSLRQLPTDLVNNLETSHIDSITFDYTNIDRY